ncbi:hypothetical protein JEQ12_004901 [Ovis aries]|uniref:RRM domain-containing protein n=1 Tax=Ovis aries TaxID=9940 RepID=A0A836CVE8_SHEEP|nr:hypothetical protein JEQ12_004901 [Ovis aries]
MGEAEEDDEEDAGFLLSLLEREGLAECPVPDQELEAIRLKLWAMEQAQGPELPRVQDLDEGEEAAGALLARQLLSPKTGRSQQARLTAVLGHGPESSQLPGGPCPGQALSPEAPFSTDSPLEKAEADHRSVYVGNVDYGGTAQELEAYFNHCGEIHRVTILCDKFSGHPKGYAYIEFATESSAQAAVELDKSIFRGRVIKGTRKNLTVVFSVLK